MRSNDAIFLLKQATRQAIWETLNRHSSGSKPDIALVGSRRSGSTLLMQIIAQERGLKSIDQPFSLPTATSAQVRHLGLPSGGVHTSSYPEERQKLREYIEAMKSGAIHVNEPWRFWKRDFNFRTNRLVLKTTDASFLLELLAEAGLFVLLYFRHPVPQSISCQRNGWGDKIESFVETRSITKNYLDDSQAALLAEVSKTEPKSLERYVLSWCIENQPLFYALESGAPAVFYEDLVLDPEASLASISSLLGLSDLKAMRKALGRPSFSVRGLSDKSVVSAIKSKNLGSLVSGWQEKIDESMYSRLQHIIDHFPNCPYHLRSPAPINSESDSS